RFLTDRAEHERTMATIWRKYWMFRPIMEGVLLLAIGPAEKLFLTQPSQLPALPLLHLQDRRHLVIPVIPFLVEIRRIRETIETVPEVANVLETRINTSYCAYVQVSP